MELLNFNPVGFPEPSITLPCLLIRRCGGSTVYMYMEGQVWLPSGHRVYMASINGMHSRFALVAATSISYMHISYLERQNYWFASDVIATMSVGREQKISQWLLLSDQPTWLPHLHRLNLWGLVAIQQ